MQQRNPEANFNPSDGISLAIVATALKLGIDLEDWASEHGASSSWLNRVWIPGVGRNLTLDQWSADKRISLIRLAKKNLGNLPDFFAELRAIQGSDSKSVGAVHTPTWLSSMVTKNAFDQWRRLHRTAINCGCILWGRVFSFSSQEDIR